MNEPFSDISKKIEGLVKNLPADQRREVARLVYPEGVGVFDNLVRKNRRVEQQLLTDELTGLPNHNAFSRALEAIKNTDDYWFVMFDVDGLKAVNDALSHSVGDELLRDVAHAIVLAAKELGVGKRRVFRRGVRADEFTVIAPKLEAEKIAKNAVDLFGRRVYQDEFGSQAVAGLTGAAAPTSEEADRMINEQKTTRRH